MNDTDLDNISDLDLEGCVIALTEFTLNTVWSMLLLTKPKVSELKRQMMIAQNGVDWVKSFKSGSESLSNEIINKHEGSVLKWATSINDKYWSLDWVVNRYMVKSLDDMIDYLVNCTLATVASMALTKSRVKREYQKQMDMAQKSVDWIKHLWVNYKAKRICDVIKQHDGSVASWVSEYDVLKAHD